MALQNIEAGITEYNTFTGGVMPDPDPTLVPSTALLDSLNLLPDRGGSGGLVTRKGTRRVGTFTLAGYRVKALHKFDVVYGNLASGKRYLVAVCALTAQTAATPDNIEIIVIDRDTGTWTRVDDATRAWRIAGGNHFGVTVDNVFYGGGEKDPIYAYRPYYINGTATSAAIAWDPDATMPQRATNAWSNASVSYALHDRVYDGDYVWVCHSAHTSSDDNRPKDGLNAEEFWTRLCQYIPDWVSGTVYTDGTEVDEDGEPIPASIVMKNITGDARYPRGLAGRAINTYSCFICVQPHTASAGNAPVTGSGCWQPYRAPVANLATYHGSRLFVRDQDTGVSRVWYSGRVTGDGMFDPSDWTVDDVQGSGWFDIRTGDGDMITGMAELGNLLVVFKRHSTHVLAGLSPSTWVLRQVAPVGAFTKRAWAELNGLLYFMSDEGLMQSDGAIVVPVPGSEYVNEYLRNATEWATDEGGGTSTQASFRVTAFDNRVWFTVPRESSTPFTFVYDPQLQSFWPIGLSTWQFATASTSGVDQLYFGSQDAPAMVLQYNHPSANNQDDTRAATYAGTNIPWFMRTGWLNFGTGNTDRKLRRLWARVRATTSQQVRLNAYKNFNNSSVWQTDNTFSGTGTVEGKVIETAQSVSLRIDGAEAPAVVLGVAAETQPRRMRYHN